MILRGGRVLPPPGVTPPLGDWPTAIAISNGRILAVGDDATVAAALTPTPALTRTPTPTPTTSDHAGSAASPESPRVIELEGRLVVPGFIDAHVHPVTGGLERLRCDLTGIVDRPQALAAIRRFRSEHPTDDWVLGGGWSMETFPGGTPRADDLDAALGDVPAFLPNRDHHSAWVNTAALRLAGVTAATPDPPGGRIERDPDGAPSGTLHEAAMDLVGNHAPAPSDAELDAALAEAQRHLLSLGITGWQDAILGEYAGMVDATDVYLRAQRSGDLRVRVAGALWWPRGLAMDDVPGQVATLAERAARIAAAGGRFSAPTVKIMLDGVTESFTAAMHEPYLPAAGRRELGTGIAYLDRDLLFEVVAACARAGFAMHIHAIGDRAVTWALEAVNAAPRPTASRPTVSPGLSSGRAPHQIAHLQIVREDDVPLWAASGAYANCQALWACHEPQMDELNLPFLGEQRSARQYPFAQLRDAGVPLAMGSDWPVSSADPLAAIDVAVNRKAAGTAYAPFLPEQAISLMDALQAYTSGSAAACGWAGVTGRLLPGMAADLAVLSGDPFDASSHAIGSTTVDLTFVEGELLHGGATERHERGSVG